MSTVLLIGTGRLAFHLGHALVHAEDRVVGVVGRSRTKANSLAEALSCPALVATDPLPQADLRILAVNDDAIDEVAAQLPDDGTPVIHLSGSKPLTLLAPHARRGVLWPIQSFGPGAPVDFSTVPLVVDADDPDTLELLETLAAKLSRHVVRLPYEQRQRLHLSAVIAANFPAFLLREAERLLVEQKIDPALIHLLWRSTAERALQGADPAVTGPARRGDLQTIAQQAGLLADEPELRRAYIAMSDLILHTYHPESRGKQDV